MCAHDSTITRHRDGERQGQDRDDHLRHYRPAQANHGCLAPRRTRAAPLRHEPRFEEMPHLNAQTRLDDDLRKLQQRHHKQKPAVDDRVKEQRLRRPKCPQA